MACVRHPAASNHDGHCPACLLEDALGARSVTDAERELTEAIAAAGGTRHLTIQVPLGESAGASVFLVKSDDPAHGLLRLKRWRQPARPGFIARFRQLQMWIDDLIEPGLPALLTAALDAGGCPMVVSEFRQGTPLIACVDAGRVAPPEALQLLNRMRTLTVRAHQMGRVHGSIVPGNIIVQPEQSVVHLLDFGLGPLISDVRSPPDSDLAGFARLTRLIEASRPEPHERRL